MRLKPSILLIALAPMIAGCVGNPSSDSQSVDEASLPVVEPTLVPMEVDLGAYDYSLLGPGASQAFDIEIPVGTLNLTVGATVTQGVGLELSYALGECTGGTPELGTFVFPGPTGTAELPASSCPGLEAGTHPLTFTLTAGMAQGTGKVTAIVLMPPTAEKAEN